ncbi:hypothetical protein SAMN05421538_11018 [Paracoccus isoporae]|uniref:Uncharacterized protein n=1 Tax=Paracoccus isoporae TaxID=591205 RepID=A0A1G7F5K2_9RHOB|nr:hypothetical protein SAMN05421538_11018 [Paracoccus isoporae]
MDATRSSPGAGASIPADLRPERLTQVEIIVRLDHGLYPQCVR